MTKDKDLMLNSEKTKQVKKIFLAPRKNPKYNKKANETIMCNI